MSKTRLHSGFIKTIVIIVIALAILAYWGFDIKKIVGSPEFKEKTAFIWGWIKDLWTNYLWHWLQWLWEHAGRPLLEWFKLLRPN